VSTRAVRVVFGRHSGPVAAVRAVAGLACAGVPLVASEVPGWAAGLGDELTRLLTAHSIDDLTDDLTREVHSIRLRRAALRTHSARARWTAFARSAALPTPRADVSVVMCTMRPDFVAPALEQIGRQSYPDVEVVLVLHGVPANLPEIRAAVAGFERPITVVEAEAAIPFGAALNQGVAVASGHLVTKWDDDDWYGPEHIADLVLAKQYSGAELVGGAKGMAYLEEINLSVYQQSRNEQYDKYMTGCTMLADRHVVCELGWFRPHPRAVDTGLWNAVRAAGGRTYTTHGLNCVVVRRVQGHTWSASFTKFLRGISHQWRGINLGPLITSDQKLDLGSHTP
jgi:Glycosyltransferases involved in cell wall biogenesis